MFSWWFTSVFTKLRLDFGLGDWSLLEWTGLLTGVDWTAEPTGVDWILTKPVGRPVSVRAKPCGFKPVRVYPFKPVITNGQRTTCPTRVQDRIRPARPAGLWPVLHP